MIRTIRRLARTAAVAAVVAVAALAGAAPASAEQFHSSILLQNFRPYATPYSQDWQPHSLRSGASINMQCWTTGPYAHRSGKWFRVRGNAYPFPVGYVPANLVGYQWTTSPRC